MNRILGTLFAATLLTACGVAPSGTIGTFDPTPDPAPLPATKAAWAPLGDAPGPRSGHTAVYDRARDRMLVFGGTQSSVYSETPYFNDTWALSTDGAPKWERFCPTGTRPAHADSAVWMDGGLFVTAQVSAWRFDPSTPTCD